MSNFKIQVPLGVVVLSGDPAVEPEGSVYYNSTTDKLRVSDGVAWSDVGGTSGTQRTFSFFTGG